MTEEEAISAIYEKIIKAQNLFCPLIKSMCRIDCVCFHKPITYEDSKSSFKISGGYCNCYMFCGD